MNKNLFIFCIIILLYTSTSRGQTSSSMVIPPSPETQTLFKFLNYPMNNSTGVPEINIPLYTIKHGDISVPISLTYHASGRKIDDVTGPVGLGWSLNCGGMISRTIYGKPDGEHSFIPSNFKTASELLSSRDYKSMASIYYDRNKVNTGSGLSLDDYDSEYDIFNYSCGVNSGKFVIDHNTNTAILFPQAPLIISQSSAVPSIITDGNGIIYNFDEVQLANYGQYSPVETGRYLTKITASNNKTKVSFLYRSFSCISGNATENCTYNDDFLINTNNYSHNNLKSSLLQKNLTTLNTENREYSERRITEIDFEEGKVVFNLEPSPSSRISNIQIKDNAGTILKTIVFSRTLLDYTGNIPNYKLDDIIIQDKNNSIIEKYHFDYLTSSNFTTQNKDIWGYRNGSNAGAILPSYQIWSYENSSMISIGNINADRNPHSDYAKMGMLSKITYPTGGSTEFTFEANRVTKLSTEVDGPGVRLKQIKNIDNSGNEYYKTYTYTAGYIPCFPDMKYNVSQKRYFFELGNPNAYPYINPQGYSYNTRVFSSDNNGDVTYQLNQPVVYSIINEYNGTLEVNSGYSSYTYSNPATGGIGKFYALDFSNCSIPYVGPLFLGALFPNTDSNTLPWYVNELILWNDRHLTNLTQNMYDGKDALGKNKYKLVKQTIYQYNTIKTGELKGIHLNKFSEFPLDSYNNIWHEVYAAMDCNVPVFMAADYTISIGKTELSSTTETDYSDLGAISTTTEFFYNDKNLIKETHKQTSVNTEIVSRYFYPFDPSLNTIEPYKTMVSRNILAPVIEQIDEQGTVPLRSIKTNYYNWGNYIIAPITIQTKSGSNSYVTQATYNSYDTKGNILQITGKDGIVTSYIWGYNQTFPVAKIVNIAQSQISSSILTAIQNYVFTNSAVYSSIQTDVNYLKTQLSSYINNSAYQVTLYTFKPLVGMSSQTDPNGVTTYYEYDDFGRLKWIKNDDGYITNRNTYHYKQ